MTPGVGFWIAFRNTKSSFLIWLRTFVASSSIGKASSSWCWASFFRVSASASCWRASSSSTYTFARSMSASAFSLVTISSFSAISAFVLASTGAISEILVESISISTAAFFNTSRPMTSLYFAFLVYSYLSTRIFLYIVSCSRKEVGVT